jgi:hypothetical protein
MEELRCTVPVIGSGFNRWFLEGDDETSCLKDWWGLLRQAATKAGVPPDAITEALSVEGDATFAWETLVHGHCRALRRRKGGKRSASDSENEMLEKVAHCVREATGKKLDYFGAPVREKASRFRDALLCRGSTGDLVSLNFDTLFRNALGDNFNVLDPYCPAPKRGNQAEEWKRSKVADPTIPATYFEAEGLRIWHPHGHVDSSKTIVLGTHRYTRSSTYVFSAFGDFKKHEQQPSSDGGSGSREIRKHNQHRIAKDLPSESRSWVFTAINAPLLLLGVGLDRSEVDLWEFFHLRARNHANVSAEDVPPIWRLTCDEEAPAKRAHWGSLSKGIRIREINLGKTWPDAWNSLLSLLEKGDEGFFP